MALLYLNQALSWYIRQALSGKRCKYPQQLP